MDDWCTLPSTGASRCPCLSPSVVAALTVNITVVTVQGQMFSAFTPGAVYPSTYGVGCGTHDLPLPPLCQTMVCGDGTAECFQSFCADAWCWVDESACLGLESTPSTFFPGMNLSYSYTTCNSTDRFSSTYLAPPPPPPDQDQEKWTVEMVTGISSGSVAGLILLALLTWQLRKEQIKSQVLRRKIQIREKCSEAYEQIFKRVTKETRDRATDSVGFYFVDAEYLRRAALERKAQLELRDDTLQQRDTPTMESSHPSVGGVVQPAWQPSDNQHSGSEEDPSFQKADASFVNKKAAGLSNWDDTAEVIEPLLPFQELKKVPGAVRYLRLSQVDCLKHLYSEHFLAISHRWQTEYLPDPGGEQRRAIEEYLLDHGEIRFVWYDRACPGRVLEPSSGGSPSSSGPLPCHALLQRVLLTAAIATCAPRLAEWCMPQDLRTAEERAQELPDTRTPQQIAEFQSMLKVVNFLYLGCRVLILLDQGYVGRFWTLFEAWLAMRKVTEEGLVRSHDDEQIHSQWAITVLYDQTAAKTRQDVLIEQWRHCSWEEARRKLAKPDVLVTNISDKDYHLGNLGTLQSYIKQTLSKSEQSWTARHSWTRSSTWGKSSSFWPSSSRWKSSGRASGRESELRESSPKKKGRLTSSKAIDRPTSSTATPDIAKV